MTRRTTLAIVLAGASLFFPMALVSAHHAMVAEFSVDKPITIRGTLTKLEWTNPHGWIHLDVKGPDGKVESWAVETGSPFRMEKRGLKRTYFRVGMDVIVNGYGGKGGARTAAGMTVTFPEREASFPAQEASFVLGR